MHHTFTSLLADLHSQVPHPAATPACGRHLDVVWSASCFCHHSSFSFVSSLFLFPLPLSHVSTLCSSRQARKRLSPLPVPPTSSIPSIPRPPKPPFASAIARSLPRPCLSIAASRRCPDLTPLASADTLIARRSFGAALLPSPSLCCRQPVGPQSAASGRDSPAEISLFEPAPLARLA